MPLWSPAKAADSPSLSPTLDAMKELFVARQALIKDRTAALNRQKEVRVPLLRRQLEQRLRQIACQLGCTRRTASEPVFG